MNQTIARLYDSPATADAVKADLATHGFGAGYVDVVTASPEPGATARAIGATGVARAHADAYAQGLASGQALVVVRPGFGYAQAASEVMQAHHPLPVTLPDTASADAPESPADLADDPAPLSSWLGWSVLSSDPTPLSNWLGWRVLKRDREPSRTRDRIHRKSADAAPLSDKLGMRVLSHDPAPLSTALNGRLLSDKAAPLSEGRGWRLLSGNPAPLSGELGWRVLLHDPAPLSRLLGMPVLSRD